jgi:hypothetical protein
MAQGISLTEAKRIQRVISHDGIVQYNKKTRKYAVQDNKKAKASFMYWMSSAPILKHKDRHAHASVAPTKQNSQPSLGQEILNNTSMTLPSPFSSIRSQVDLISQKMDNFSTRDFDDIMKEFAIDESNPPNSEQELMELIPDSQPELRTQFAAMTPSSHTAHLPTPFPTSVHEKHKKDDDNLDDDLTDSAPNSPDLLQFKKSVYAAKSTEALSEHVSAVFEKDSLAHQERNRAKFLAEVHISTKIL